MVTGTIMPGNRTRLRTGMMISASTGGLAVTASPTSPAVCEARVSTMSHSHFLQRDEHTAVDHGSANALVSSSRKPNAAFKSALRQFQSMDRCSPKHRWELARPGDEKIAVVNDRYDLIGVDVWQTHKDENLLIGLENI